MDNIIHIQTEDHLPDDFALPNEAGFFTTVFKMETHSDAVQPNDRAVVKQEAFFPEDHIMNESHQEFKMEIKEERWWLEKETSSVSANLMDGDIPSVNSLRSSLEEHSRVKPPTTEDSNTGGQRNEFLCEFCGKTYKAMWRLKNHQKCHSSEKQHECGTCGKRYKWLTYLKHHNLIHEDKKPHSCKICGKSYIWMSHLKTHIMVHEGNKPYQCNTCGKCFTRPQSLKGHSWIHDDKKPYSCRYCDKVFRHRSTLRLHNMIHDDEKPHRCTPCNKQFRGLSALKNHNFSHHRNQGM